MTKLTTQETIARIERFDSSYPCSIDMIDARDLLTFHYEFNEPYHPAINQDELNANFAYEIEQHPDLTEHQMLVARDMMDLLLTLPLDSISQMRLDRSLCPLHGCDYAACFDDDDQECEQIRRAFPSHDT